MQLVLLRCTCIMCTCSQTVGFLVFRPSFVRFSRFHLIGKCIINDVLLNSQWECYEGFERVVQCYVLCGLQIHCLSFIFHVPACDFVLLLPLQSNNNFSLDMTLFCCFLFPQVL